MVSELSDYSSAAISHPLSSRWWVEVGEERGEGRVFVEKQTFLPSRKRVGSLLSDSPVKSNVKEKYTFSEGVFLKAAAKK